MQDTSNNQDTTYKAVVTLYEALRNRDQEVAQPSLLINKLDRLVQGLTAEDEFAAFCLWSGKCSLIHKLDKFVRPKGSEYRVPDFLCVLEYQGKSLPLLVEVKSTIRESYPLTRAYCERLDRYADTVGLPLLIAFKFTKYQNPFWCLFEFDKMRTPQGSYRVNMPEILRHNLTGVLLGDFSVQLWQGTTISMTVTKEKVYSETEFVGQMEDIHWETKDKQRVESVPLLHLLFALTQDEVNIEELPNKLIQRFTKLYDEAATAYWCLQFALPVKRYQVRGRTDWGRLIDEQEFSFTLQDLKNASVSGIKSGIAKRVMNQIPVDWPAFLPKRRTR